MPKARVRPISKGRYPVTVYFRQIKLLRISLLCFATNISVELFEYIFLFHASQGANSNNKPRWERAIDLGCRTGEIFLYITIITIIIIDDIRSGDIASGKTSENALKETPDAKVGSETPFIVEWPLALILTRKN